MSKLANIIISLFVIITPLCADDAPTAREINEALVEVKSAHPAETDIEVKVLEYRVVDGHIANLGIWAMIDHPLFYLSGSIHTRHSQLGAITPAFQHLEPSITGVAQFDLSLTPQWDTVRLFGDPSLPRDLSPLTPGQWQLLMQYIDMANAMSAEGPHYDAQILSLDDAGHIKSFEVVTTHYDSVQSECRIVITLGGQYAQISIFEESVETDLATEQVLMETFEAIRNRDPEMMEALRWCFTFAKAYLDALLTI